MNRFNRLTILSLVCLASAAQAQDIRWLTGTGGAWSTAANWFNSVAPSAGTGTNDVYIDYAPYATTAGVNNFVTTLNYAASVKRLFSRAGFTIQSNNLTLGADGSVMNGTFTLQSGGLLGFKTITLAGPAVFETGNAKTLAANVTTQGTVTLTGGYVLLTNSTLNIANTSAMTITGDFHWYDGVINNAGSITKTGGAGTAYLNLNSGGGTQALNNTGTITSNSGTLEMRVGGTHTGSFVASAGNTLFFNGGNHSFTGSTINGNGVILGNNGAKYTWNGTNTFVNSPEFRDGTFAGTGTLSGGTLRLTSSTKIFQDSLTRVGATSFEAGGCYSANATFNNQGVFSMAGDLSWYDGIFNNTGTIQKTSGAGTGYICYPSGGGPRALNNSGTVTSSAGYLALYGNGTCTGTFTSSGSGYVRLAEGTWNLNAGASFGAGDVGIRGATAILNANIGTQPFTFEGGTITGTGNLTTNGLFSFTSGTVTGAGALNTKAATNLSTGTAKYVSRAWTNDGTINHQGGALYLTNGSLTNKSIFDFQGDVHTYDGVFVNNVGATVKKSSGANTAYIGYPSGGGTTSFTNAGTVLAQSGNIQIQCNGTHTGSASALAGANVLFPTGVQAFQSGATLGNNCIVNGATATFTGTVTFGTVDFSSGTFNGTGTLASGVLHITSGASRAMNGTLTRSATTNWDGGAIYGTNSTFNNQGSFNMIGDLTWYDGIFNNSGTFSKTSGAGTGTVCANSGGGTRQFNNTGTVTSSSGRLQLAGGGTHTGTFTSSGTGKVRFQEGLHNINAGTVFGAGDIGMDNPATVTVNANINANQFTMEGGTLNGTGNMTCSGLFEFDAGTAAGTGQIIANAGMAFRTSAGKTLTKTVNAFATSTFEAGNIAAANSTFTNNGTFDYKGDFAYYDGIFNNKGTVTKTSGAGTAYMCYPSGGGTSQFNNTGTVNILTGSLDIRGNGSHKGTFGAVAPATVVFPAGTQTFQTGCSFGNGVTFNGVTATFQGGQTLTGNVSWTGGQFKGSATFDGGKFLWSGSRDLKNAPIFNSDVDWSGGTVAGNTSAPTFNGKLDLTGDTTFYDGYITNNGTVVKSNGNGTCYFSYPNSGGLRGFYNAGTLEAKKGAIQISSGFSNFDPFTGVMLGGTIIVQDGAGIQYTNSQGAIVDNRARINLYGTTSTFRQSNNTEALLGCKTNYGSIAGRNGRSITVSTPFSTSGDVTMDTGGTFTVSGASDFTQTGGKTVIDGTLAAATTTITGGLFSGAGTVNGVVTNTSGTVAPGSLVGPLTIATSYAQGAAGKMLVRINSAGVGDFGSIATGNASLAGALAVTVLPGATVTTGQKFRILTCTGTRTGTFNPPADPASWTTTYNTKYVELTAKKTIVGSAGIAGNLTLGQFKGNNVAQPITMELWNGNTLVESQVIYVQQNGDFEFFTTQTGTFDIKAKASHWLRQSVNGVDVSSGVSGLNFNLINGDVDNSNGVGTDDYLILNSSFGLNLGDAGYDARADLDGDFTISSDDYLILNENFDQYGD
jgi:hypothetical protein